MIYKNKKKQELKMKNKKAQKLIPKITIKRGEKNRKIIVLVNQYASF